MRKHFIAISIALFVILTIVFVALKVYMPSLQLGALMTGNAVMALLTIATYNMIHKNMNERPQAFVRGVTGATLLKLIVCIVAILLYVLIKRPNVDKPSVFMLFGIYIAYTITETWLLSLLARQAK